MHAIEDSTIVPDEPKSARLEARAQPSVKDAIQRAATLNGVDLSAFMVNAAYAAAKDTLSAHSVTVLASKADKDAFFNALENPPAPTKRLAQAFALRETMVVNAD
jgi:uncharacterized protein (DUF1778 family)